MIVSNTEPDADEMTKRALLAERLRQAAEDAPRVPLSFAQQRLWFLDQLEPDSALYNMPMLVRMDGHLDSDALQHSLHQLAERHEILRTRFVSADGDPVQVVDGDVNVKIAFHDLTKIPDAKRKLDARQIVRSEINRPFNLSSGPLLRAALLRLGETEHLFLLNLHHIVSDEWSLKVCFKELTALYEARVKNHPPRLPELPIQYADYALWQRESLSGEIVENQLAYWRERLRGNPPVLELPTDRPRAALPTFSGGSESRELPAELCRAVCEFAERRGGSSFMVLLAAFKTLLHRYTRQNDIVVGTPVAGRTRIETEGLIGFFVNTLLLRTDFSENPTFEELFLRIRETTLGAISNQDLPFEKLVEELRPERTLDHMPFTRLMFAVQNNGFEKLHWPGVTLEFLEADTDTSKFDLTFVVQETGEKLIAKAEFNSGLFNRETISRLLLHFETLLSEIIANPARRISQFPILTGGERRQFLSDWNFAPTDYPREKTVAQLFEIQAERSPDSVAVSFGKKTLTWRELNTRANQLARHLKTFSIGADTPVGLCMERSPEMVVAMVAILKAGGAYVPLDPGYPKPRLAFMLEDSNAPVLITNQNFLNHLPTTTARVICLDSDWELIARESASNLPNRITPENLAYVMYTSGSTGRPKGVAVPHRAIVRLVRNTNYIQLTPSDRIAQISNASFDAATFEIWGALLNGARLVGISKDITLSARDFARELRDEKISVMFLTTALFNQIAAEAPDAFATLRVLMFGGETVDPKWARVVLQHPPAQLLHVYGPTENTTFSTWHDVRSVGEEDFSVPIGKPISNTQCYVLDAYLNPVPIGVPGELHLAGDGLARGYWNRRDLDAEKFIANPFRDGAGSERLYKTGDLARWTADGELEFLGRLDHQVKIRGFRVEPGEIESVLSQHDSVKDCAVTVRVNGAGKKLAAYFAPRDGSAPGVSELQSFLREKLPDYMIPSAFIRLDSLPLSPNGKVDRAALPEPDHGRPELEKSYATPRDSVETELTRIWENVLAVRPIGIRDKFFELGGHSLLAVRVIAQIEKAFARKLRVATIFQAQTIEQLAAILRKEIQEDNAASGSSIVEIQPKGSKPPVFFVHGAGGGMFWGYVNLSRHLGSEQPVYGIRAQNSGGEKEFQTVEKMAARYIPDIRAIQPRGPYHLGGYCFGGNIAYEIARQLREQGEEIANLSLFNCSPANSRYSRVSFSPRWFLRFLKNLCYWTKYFLSWTRPQRRGFFRWKKQLLIRRAYRLLGHSRKAKAAVDAGEFVDLSSYSDEQRQLWEEHIRALVTYQPKPFDGRVHLFRSSGHPLLCSFDADYGWNDFAKGGVEIHIVPGVHEKILEEPCVETLARQLADVLEKSREQKNLISSAPEEKWSVSIGARVKFPLEKSYAAHFESQAARTPNAAALRFENSELTYAELNSRANQLARHLQSLGVGPETLVAVCLERSLELPVALLAVLKSGGAYVPLDRSYPAERLDYMLADSKARVLITDSNCVSGLKTNEARVVCLDDANEQKEIGKQSKSNPICAAAPENLAYVIYTSGSTGAPKGVQIEHRSLLNHNFAIAREYRLQSADRILQFSAFSFDISVEEIFPAWLNGCALVLRTDEAISSMTHFFEFVRREQLSVLNIPTAYWHELTEHLEKEKLPECVRLVVIGGEKASESAWRRWKFVGSGVKLINSYGPTETTVTATSHLAESENDAIPIGHPLANTSALILNSERKIAELGETGELFIGGAGVARGYLNRPELTGEKFIPNPFSEIESERLYATGDLARIREDGEIEFIGRKDEQIKIRGYRIEPGEIENTLRLHPAIKEAVVLAREDSPGNKRLVAYFSSRDASVAGNDLRHFLKSKLPAHMVPSVFVSVASMPLTPGGKVDRKSLPAPGNARPELDQEYVAPRNPVEEVLASIWCEVLALNRIGIHDNFFDLGGHSLLAIQVISRMRETMQVELSLANFFVSPTIAALAERLSDAANPTQPVLPVSRVSKGNHLPLTPAQQRIWFLDQFEPEQSSYNISTAFRLQGELNLSALEKSLTELARRHPALRTVFPVEDGFPTQIVCQPREILLPVTDLRDLPEAERESRMREIAAQSARKTYVMFSPMLRPTLLRMADREHVLLMLTNGIACDTQSVRILFAEWVRLYEAFANGAVPNLKPLPLTYAEALEKSAPNPVNEPAHLDYWKKQLADAPALLDLPADFPRPAHQSDAGARQVIELPKHLSIAVEELSRKYDCAPFTVLLAVFQTLLSRYSGSADIVVGSSISKRAGAEFENVIGKFDNLVAFRGDLSGDPTFEEFLNRLRKTTSDALAHSDLPFEKLISELHPPRNASYTPVFQVIFDYDETPLTETEAAEIRFTPIGLDNFTSKLDLHLHLSRNADGLSGWIEYSTALFKSDRIARLISHFETLLESASRNPAERVSVLPLMPEAESRRILVEWNATEKPYPKNATLIHLFEEQARRSPKATALIAGDQQLSYGELNARANQLACHLRSLGVRPGVLVGICLERTWRLLVGILGVLKAGGAYVPMDPAYPKERLKFILEDTRAPVLLTQESLREIHPPRGTHVVCIDSDWPRIRSNSAENIFVSPTANDLAYVIYTSGSTGKPKGVALEHRGAVALMSWARDVFTAEELSGVLACTSVCFDLSVFEMFTPLSWGGTVILAENALALPELPAANRVTLVNTVPSAIRALLRVKGIPPSVRVVNLAGEPLATSLVNQIYSETAVEKVYDLYGPSETTTYSTFTLRRANEPATIGRPLANEQVYLLDANRQPTPIGIPGELHIGGDKLARGYLNRPELTAEKFISNPFKPGTRLYKTGDVARWRADGNLEFLGRLDHQVKLRGYRIELGEIETALRKNSNLREVVVVVREDSAGNKQLVAYVVAHSGKTAGVEELRAFAKARLPEYMVPSAFVFLQSLPLTPNGKVNRAALPDPDNGREDERRNFVAPRNPVEEQIAAIWREVLRVEKAGAQDNFFELGGDSLIAIQVISRIRETFKVELPLFSLFDAPTIESLAKGLASGAWTQNQIPILPLQSISREGRLAVSFVQERLWFLDQLEPGNHAYNVPVALRLKGPLDLASLQRAFDEIASRHEALRTTLHYSNGELFQKIAPPAPAILQLTNLESASAEEREVQLQKWLNTESQRAFDLSAGPLFRVHLARLDAEEHALLVVMHHTISDGWSLTVLFQELQAFYDAFSAGKPAPALADLPIQPADFGHWKRQWMQGTILENELAYWKRKLAGAPASLDLPADFSTSNAIVRRAARQILKLPPEFSNTLVSFSQREGATPFVLLMTALAASLQKWTRQNDMVIGTVVAGRNHRELENVIGCFMNFLPVRVQAGDTKSGSELLAEVKSTVLDAQSHQDCPFEKIVEAVNPQRRLDQNPLYNVALLLQNFPAQIFRSERLQTSTLPTELEAPLLDLRFEAELDERGLSIACEYKTDLFEAGTIEQFLALFQNVLETIISKPETRLADCAIPEPLQIQSAKSRNRNRRQVVQIAATFTAEPVEESLRYWFKELEIQAEAKFAPFNQIFQQLLDPTSELAANSRGLNILLVRPEDWLEGNDGNRLEDAEKIAAEFVAAVKSAASRTAVPFLVLFCPASRKTTMDSRRKEILDSMEEFTVAGLEKESGVHVVTTRELLETYPVADFYDESGDELGRVPYAPAFFTALGTMIARKFHALQRAPHKVIVLDCDQTLWSGVCGEDGARGICLDAPRIALQEFMRAQHDFGKLLALCSKNNEDDVREVFAQRLDMPLRHDHFAAWRLNWQPKSENIKSMAAELNLGLDSFIFVDDNPVECAEVEANCPEVLTLLLPEPEKIPNFLKHCWAFDSLKITDEDRKRGELYRENRKRQELQKSSMSLADFVAGLDLKIQVEPMSAAQLPRVAQLTHRTNQFNCTTIRRSETEIQQLAADREILTVSVQDRFGDYGLVGVVIFKNAESALDVETFLLSCRVLGRGVEREILARLGKRAVEEKKNRVDVRFNPSAKNKPAFDFLQSVGASFRQPLNGGYVYRFPAEFAADVVFNPESVAEIPAEKSESKIANRPTQSGKFAKCRAIALESCDALAIHQAIESKASVRSGKTNGYIAPSTELERELCSIYEKLLRIERVGVNDNFFELGGHSLLAVRLFAEIEKLVGRKFPLVTIFQAPTIGQLARALGNSDHAQSRSPIVPVQPNGSRPPLFLVHGAGGDVLWGYANLAKHMPDDQPIYGIKSRGQIGLEEFDTITEMARYYVQEIRAFQPSGPYFLGGYCLGGNVAYEMARQLHSEGERVGLVALLDAFPSNAGYERVTWWQPNYPFRFARNACYWLSDFVRQPYEDQRKFIVRKSRILGRKLLRTFQKRNGAGADVDLEEVIDPSYFPKHELKFWEIHLRALVNHTEQPYPGTVTLIRTRGQPLFCSLADDFCWSKLARGVAVKHIPGSHENIFIEPNVKHLARQLQMCLDAARKNQDSEIVNA
ncbi:MAG TPA: amino acid adenylation domain-containing protein [Verrucomicrobiae bacterium]|nr:amino acid adenylation domain-containing protein [Verrucomicrobiae bacterium]